MAGQTADVLRVEDSVGDALFAVDPNGKITATNDWHTVARLNIGYAGGGVTFITSIYGTETPVNINGVGFRGSRMETVLSNDFGFVQQRETKGFIFKTADATNDGGIDRLRVAQNVAVQNANLLVGTTTDTGEKLQVAGSVRTSGYLHVGSSSRYFTASASGLGSAIFNQVGVATTDAYEFRVGGTPKLTISREGSKVGINTSATSELATLTVSGVYSSSPVAVVRAATGQTADVFRVEDSVGSALLNIDASGNLAIGSDKRLYLDGGTDTYIHESSSNRIEFVTAGVPRFEISSAGLRPINNGSGDFGTIARRWNEMWANSMYAYEKMIIGTTTDTGEKLQVAGTVRIGDHFDPDITTGQGPLGGSSSRRKGKSTPSWVPTCTALVVRPSTMTAIRRSSVEPGRPRTPHLFGSSKRAADFHGSSGTQSSRWAEAKGIP